MRAIREWQATRQWGRLPAAHQRRPAAAMRWDTGARVLCLLPEGDAAARRIVDTMTWRSIGIDADAGAANGVRPKLEPEVITWSDTSDKSPERPEGLWTPAQLNYAGLLRREVAAAWQTRDYDFVISFFAGAFAPVDFFCAGVRAHLRVAMHEECLPAYDLVLEPAAGAGVAGFAAELARYLHVLNPSHAR